MVWRDLPASDRAGEVVYETLITTPWLAGSLTAWHLAHSDQPPGLCRPSRSIERILLLPDRTSPGSQRLPLCPWSGPMADRPHDVRAEHRHDECDARDSGDAPEPSSTLPESRTDVEGGAARRRLVASACLRGPAFALCACIAPGWTLAGRTQRAGGFSLRLVALAADWRRRQFSSTGTPLRAHVATMIVGQCFTAFFAVWTVHHDCDRRPGESPARSAGGSRTSCPTTCSTTWSTICFLLCPPVTFPNCPGVLMASAQEYTELTVY